MTCSACTGPWHLGTAFCASCGERLHDRFVGTLLDERYRIEARIAAGGFGTIYRAIALATNQPVAIKVLHAQHTSDPSVSARFRRESIAMSSLRDPHTVTTLEIGEDAGGTRFIVMELLQGQSLADRFAATGPLHWRTVLSIVRAVCSSLAEAHALGIVHRDLKPANIFLAQHPAPDFVKVLDFGIAKILHGSNIDDGNELTRIGQAIGTLEYMSPEQLIGGDVDHRTDIYTLGVVAYELLTGRRPFADVTGPTGLVTALMTRRPPPPSTVARGPLPPELDGVLLRCLEREAPDRYGNVGELIAVIDRMLMTREQLVTTQRIWNRTPVATVAPAVVDDLDDDTVLDMRPLFPHEPSGFGELAHQLESAQPVFDDIARQQVLARDSEPRVWRVAGTGAPSLQQPQPEPESPFAVGTGMVAGGTTTNAPVPTSIARILVWAMMLALLGLGLGMAIAYAVA
ncbi:MAG TPA: serine/threonine-protein kinase [Kofleriaceae bacterium]|nr:serine/threonine-protein kinase [Kofleriaceae bacterium]